MDERWQDVQKWWAGLGEEGQKEWRKDKPHIPFVAVSRDGYWGRGQTQEEAIKQMRKAGFTGKLNKRVQIYVLPEGLLDGSISPTGCLEYYYDPVTGLNAKAAAIAL